MNNSIYYIAIIATALTASTLIAAAGDPDPSQSDLEAARKIFGAEPPAKPARNPAGPGKSGPGKLNPNALPKADLPDIALSEDTGNRQQTKRQARALEIFRQYDAGAAAQAKPGSA